MLTKATNRVGESKGLAANIPGFGSLVVPAATSHHGEGWWWLRHRRYQLIIHTPEFWVVRCMPGTASTSMGAAVQVHACNAMCAPTWLWPFAWSLLHTHNHPNTENMGAPKSTEKQQGE